MAPLAVAEIVITSVYFILPFTPAAQPVQRRLRVEVRQLRADRHSAARCIAAVDRLARVGQEVVHRAEEHDRPARGRHVGRRDRARAPRQDRPRRPAARLEAGRPDSPDGTTVSDLEQLLDGIPVLTGQGRHVTPLPGGLTNPNYRVRTDAGLDVVVRVSARRRPGCSASTGTPSTSTPWPRPPPASGAPVVDYLEGLGVLVVGFLPGRTWTDADVGAPTCPGSPAPCAGCTPGPPSSADFDMFALRRPVPRHRARARLPDAGRLRRARAVRRPRRAGRSPAPRSPSCRATTTCWPANVLDDGGDLRIIDYEYSGMNEPSFELGNTADRVPASARTPSPSCATAYYGRHDDALRRPGRAVGLDGASTAGRCGG